MAPSRERAVPKSFNATPVCCDDETVRPGLPALRASFAAVPESAAIDIMPDSSPRGAHQANHSLHRERFTPREIIASR